MKYQKYLAESLKQQKLYIIRGFIVGVLWTASI